jgi:hypothetical protein
MPTKKQRKRREKGKRHEYEYVLLDEEGQETPLDPAELRQAKREKDKNGAKPTTAAKDRKGRAIREVKPPSWRRALNRAAIFVVALLVLTSFIGKTHPSVLARVVIAFGYGIIGVPLFYVMDRAAYRRYLRVTGREAPPPPKRGS